MSISLRGKYICFTGKVIDFTRADLEEMAAQYGFTFMSSVTSTTDILVIGERPGATKLEKAQRLDIKTWTAEDFIMMLTQDEADKIKPIPEKLTPEENEERVAYYEKHELSGIF